MFRSVPTRPEIENSKKIVKKFKNTIMASFQANIDWKSMRKRENKYYRSVPTRHVIENSKEIAKKVKKLS